MREFFVMNLKIKPTNERGATSLSWHVCELFMIAMWCTHARSWKAWKEDEVGEKG